MEFTDELRKQIQQSLEQKGALGSCERCGSGNFTLLDGYFRQDVQNDMQNVVMGGPSVPTISMACSNCGNMSFFAVKALLPNHF
jgi:ribosomal protein S27AE